MAENYEINWDGIASKAKQIDQSALSRGSMPTDGTTSSYLKMVEPGTYKLRILPMGNYIDNLPFKEVVRHELRSISNEGSRITLWSLCWDFIQKEREGIARPLAKMQKLFKEDSEKYRQYGCPICQFRQALWNEANGIRDKIAAKPIKEMASAVGPRVKYLWNVIARNDGNVYVYSCSKTIGETIIGQMDTYRENKINVLDLRTGYDFQITAEGPNNENRRYKSPMFLAIPKPAVKGNAGDIIPHDLTEYACQNFQNYQSTIDMLLQAYGKKIARMGYSVGGDESSWDEAVTKGHPPVPHSELRDVFEEEVPRNKRIKREDYNSPDDYFDAAVPPSDEGNEVIVRTSKTKKKNGAKVVGKDYSRRQQENDDDDNWMTSSAKSREKLPNQKATKVKGKNVRDYQIEDDDEIPF